MNREQTFESKLDDILLKIGWKYFEELNGYRKESNFTIPMWSTNQEKSWDCISVGNYLELKELILQDRERAVREAVSKTVKRERDRSFAEHMKVKEFYAGSKRRLKELAFPSHCSSCHSEWEDGYGDQEEPCCSRAKSNIIDNIMKWHINESADEDKKAQAQLSNPTQEKEGEVKLQPISLEDAIKAMGYLFRDLSYHSDGRWIARSGANTGRFMTSARTPRQAVFKLAEKIEQERRAKEKEKEDE